MNQEVGEAESGSKESPGTQNEAEARTEQKQENKVTGLGKPNTGREDATGGEECVSKKGLGSHCLSNKNAWEARTTAPPATNHASRGEGRSLEAKTR